MAHFARAKTKGNCSSPCSFLCKKRMARGLGMTLMVVIQPGKTRTAMNLYPHQKNSLLTMPVEDAKNLPSLHVPIKRVFIFTQRNCVFCCKIRKFEERTVPTVWISMAEEKKFFVGTIYIFGPKYARAAFDCLCETAGNSAISQSHFSRNFSMTLV